MCGVEKIIPQDKIIAQTDEECKRKCKKKFKKFKKNFNFA